jgi:hypothetical protein
LDVPARSATKMRQALPRKSPLVGYRMGDQDRRHFVRMAARAMRRLLVDRAGVGFRDAGKLAVPKDTWELTQSEFDSLLARLDPDRERAGVLYEMLRRKLVQLFEWQGWPATETTPAPC